MSAQRAFRLCAPVIGARTALRHVHRANLRFELRHATILECPFPSTSGTLAPASVLGAQKAQ